MIAFSKCLNLIIYLSVITIIYSTQLSEKIPFQCSDFIKKSNNELEIYEEIKNADIFKNSDLNTIEM